VDPAFERALVATSYLLGVRDDVFEGWPLGSDALSLVRALTSEDRETRVTVLAREVTRIALSLDKGALT
jgi:hypothetical protein